LPLSLEENKKNPLSKKITKIVEAAVVKEIPASKIDSWGLDSIFLHPVFGLWIFSQQILFNHLLSGQFLLGLQYPHGFL